MSNPTPTNTSLDEFLDYCMERTVYMQDQPVAGDWREQTKKPMLKKLKSLIAAQVQQGKREVVARIENELVGAQSIEINKEDSGVTYYYTVKSVEWAIERVVNQIHAELAALQTREEKE